MSGSDIAYGDPPVLAYVMSGTDTAYVPTRVRRRAQVRHPCPPTEVLREVRYCHSVGCSSVLTFAVQQGLGFEV
eukprot:2899787-Rhodomonas_salina.3